MSTSQLFPVSPKPETLIEALSIIKQQAYQFKLLDHDNKIKDQTIDILKGKIKEMEKTIPEYQNQVALLEESLNDYRQEFHLKVQAELIQNQKLIEANERLLLEKEQLENKVKVVEEEKNISKESFQEIYDEIQELRLRSSRAQQAILDTRDMLYKKQNELVETETKLIKSELEKEELYEKTKLLSKENEELVKIIGGKVNEMEEFIKINEGYKALQKAYEQELSNISSLNEAHEQLKRKHEGLVCDFDLKALEVKQQEANVKNQTVKIEGLQKQVDKLKAIITQKDTEISKLNQDIAKNGEIIKEEEAKLALSIQRAIELIKAQEIEFDHKVEKKSIYNDAMHKLMQSIVEQNRQLVDLREAHVVEESEYQYLEKMITELGTEKEEFFKNHTELLQNYEELERRFQEAQEASVQEKNELHVKFEKELENMISLVNNADIRVKEELAKKDDEIYELLQDQKNAKMYVESQEKIMKEMKDKFMSFIEDANFHKGRFEKVSFVLATFLKIFVNLLMKFKTLASQKSFLSQYYLQYKTLKDKLAEMHLIDSQTQKEKTVIQKFKKTVLVIRAALRIKKLEERHKDTSIDEYELVHSLDNLPVTLRRFICGLFKRDSIGLERGIVDSIGNILKDFNGLNENLMISRIISSLGNVENEEEENIFGDWLSSKGKKAQRAEVRVKFEINNDMVKKIEKLDKKLKANEETMHKKENQYKGKIDDLVRQLEKAKEQTETYKKSNEKLINEFDKLKEEVVELLTWIKERGQNLYTQTEETIEEIPKLDEKRENAKLQEKITNLHSNMLAVRRNNLKLQKLAKAQDVEGDQENLMSYESLVFLPVSGSIGLEKAMKESSKINTQ